MPTSVWLDDSECSRDGRLPPVCMKCGTDAHATRRQNLSWCPGWVWLLIFLGWLPWLIVRLILTKSMVVYAPLCPQHQGHFLQKKLIGYTLVFVGLGALIGGIALQTQSGPRNDIGPIADFGFAIGAFVFLVSLIAALIVFKLGINPTEITDRDIQLKGVHEEFVAALKDQRREERAEREKRRSERDDDEDDDRPRARRTRYED